MKWKFRSRQEKFAERIEKTCTWHKWFAWYPVTIVSDNDVHYKVWMQYVGRKNKIHFYSDESGIGKYTTAACKYCDEQDLIIKTLIDNEIEDNTRGEYKEFLKKAKNV